MCICVWDSVYLCDMLLSPIVCVCVCPCVCIHLGALSLGAAGADTGFSISRTPRLSRAEPEGLHREAGQIRLGSQGSLSENGWEAPRWSKPGSVTHGALPGRWAAPTPTLAPGPGPGPHGGWSWLPSGCICPGVGVWEARAGARAGRSTCWASSPLPAVASVNCVSTSLIVWLG